LKAAQEAVAAHPDSSQAHRKLGEIYLDLKQLPDGAAELQTAVQLDPNSEPAYRALARLYQSTRYLDYETEALRRLVTLRTQDPQVYLRLGQIYMELNWLKQAEAPLRRAAQLAPDSPAPQRELAGYEFESGQSDAAIQRLQAAHRRFPESVPNTDRLGQYLMAAGRIPEAEAMLRDAVRRQPADPTLERLLAYCLLRQNNPALLSEAIAILEKTVQRGQATASHYFWLGRAYERLGRTSDAIVAYQRTVELQPATEDVAFALGRLYLRQDRKEMGERYVSFYRQIRKNSIEYDAAYSRVRNNPDNAEALLHLADWEARIHAYPRAIMDYRRVQEMRPGDARARNGLYKALMAVGRRTEARALKA
jgi:cytochrome c-type biogenesis protein CcmH/NrfG